MSLTLPSSLTERHLTLFGVIVQWFARHELLMERLMAQVAGTDSASTIALTRGLSLEGKRDALHDLLRHHNVPGNQFDHIYADLLLLDTYGPLYNDILHSAWLPGTPPDSIQPNWLLRIPKSVQPMHAGTEVDDGTFRKGEEDKVTYSLQDLEYVAEKLADNCESFSDYLTENGLMKA